MKLQAASHSGEARKANVGISNDKTGGKPVHRKTEGFLINANRIRVSRVLRGERKRSFDGQAVNIPLLI